MAWYTDEQAPYRPKTTDREFWGRVAAWCSLLLIPATPVLVWMWMR